MGGQGFFLLLWCSQSLRQVLFKNMATVQSQMPCLFLGSSSIPGRLKKKKSEALCSMWEWTSPLAVMSSYPHFSMVVFKNLHIRNGLFVAVAKAWKQCELIIEGACLTEGLFTSSWRELFPFCIRTAWWDSKSIWQPLVISGESTQWRGI